MRLPKDEVRVQRPPVPGVTPWSVHVRQQGATDSIEQGLAELTDIFE